jgi:hypothetical protein
MITRNISLIIVLLFCSCSKSMSQPKPAVVSLNAKVLERSKTKIANKDESLSRSYKQLIKDADKALLFGPVSVMEKKNDPPSGDKHDYMSLAPYHWPDSSKPNGLPYMRKDGQTNPEVKEYKDKDYLPKLCESVYVLGLAYYFSEDKTYAEHAANLVRVWFLDAATRMNPNLKYGQAIKGVNDGRGAGMIDTRHLVKLIDGIGLIKSSKSWKPADEQAMKQWFSEFLNWMQTSKQGTDEMKAKNNHGAWYDAQRLAFALYIDSTDLAKKIVANAADRLDKQMDEKGFFPLEMERTTSLHYTTFVIEAFIHIANMAEKTGFDFWNHTTPGGHSLKQAIMTLKPYLAQEKNWEGEQIKDFDYEEGYTILMEAAAHYKCKDCAATVQRIADDKAPRLRLNLLYN